MKLRAKLMIHLLRKVGMKALKRRKKQIVKLINAKFDLKKMNEKQEEELLNTLFEIIIEVLENL